MCGSPHHPSPAPLPGEAPDEAAVETARRESERAGEAAALADREEAQARTLCESHREALEERREAAGLAAGEETAPALRQEEERLAALRFARISHSEIINLKQVKALDLTFTGTIRITLADGTVCWASRRYVKKIKEVLGL